MEQKTNDEFMRYILIEEAWKEVSNNFSWSETLLEKYKNRVDWDKISSNNNIRWTIPMIAKFSKYINWITFSESANEEVLTPEVIETFKDNWDWHCQVIKIYSCLARIWRNMQTLWIGKR